MGRPLPAPRMSGDPFRRAAQAYLVYGVVYWIGGVYLALHGVGVGGDGAGRGRALASIVVGTMFLVFIPMLLARPRPWFERRVLTRRNFARVLVLFLLVRAYKVGQVAFRTETATVVAPWGGEVTYRAGAQVFLVVTIVALVVIARAAWSRPSRPVPDEPTGVAAPAPDARPARPGARFASPVGDRLPDGPLPSRSSRPSSEGGPTPSRS